RPDHRRARPRSRAGRRRRAPSSRAVPPRQGPRGVVLSRCKCWRIFSGSGKSHRFARERGRSLLRVRICVVGCGAVGSLFAANLARLEDVEVWAYDLARDHVDAINRDGLRLSGAEDVVGPVRATSDAADLPPCDFGIVATKAMHTATAIEATAAAFARGAVASVQNGVGNEEAIAGHVERVIRGTT